MAKCTNPLAPYHVQVRNFERRLVLGALAAVDGHVPTAAAILGVQEQYLRYRAMILGGILNGDSKHEPPLTVADVVKIKQVEAVVAVVLPTSGRKRGPRASPETPRTRREHLAPLPLVPVPQIPLPPLDEPRPVFRPRSPEEEPYVTAYTMPDDPEPEEPPRATSSDA